MWESGPVPQWARRMTIAIVSVTLAGTSVVLAARLTGWQVGPLLFLVTGTPYLSVVCVVAAVAAAVVRSWALTALACLGFLTVAVLWAPPCMGSRDTAGPTELTVMTLNLQFGRADAQSVVAAVRDSGAQLLSVQELTPTAQAGFERAGLDELLPFRYTVPLDRASGTGIWSAYPLSGKTELTGTWLANLTATAATPDGPVTVVALHAGAPLSLDHVRADLDAQVITDQLVQLRQPSLVAGDFNATRDNRFIRQLEGRDFTDTATAAGAGLLRTWPNDRSPVPPVIGIDHIMTKGFPGAVAVRTFAVAGTDHLGLIVQLPGPRPPE